MFTNVPNAVIVAFYGVGRHDAADRRVARVAARPELRARPARRPAHDPEERRTAARATSAAGVWMQTLLRDPAAGVMHSFLYFGFVLLFIATVISEIDHQMPDRFKFLHGNDVSGVLGRRRRRRHRRS